MKRVGVTGGVASGKSLLVSLLGQAGAYCLDADRVVHRLLDVDLSIQHQVVCLLGSSVLEQGRVNRSKVASLVFSNHKLLHSLEAILQPAAFAEIQAAFLSASAEEATLQGQLPAGSALPSSLFIVEASVLLQAGWRAWFDCIVVVAAEEPLRRARYALRANSALLSFSGLAAAQWPEDRLILAADYVLENNGTQQELRTAAEQLLAALLSSVRPLS